MGFHRRCCGGVEIFVKLTPKSVCDAIESVEINADVRAYLKVRVRAAPEKGKANKALVALVAKMLRLPASTIHVVSGNTARLKTLKITGNTEVIETRLEQFQRP